MIGFNRFDVKCSVTNMCHDSNYAEGFVALAYLRKPCLPDILIMSHCHFEFDSEGRSVRRGNSFHMKHHYYGAYTARAGDFFFCGGINKLEIDSFLPSAGESTSSRNPTDSARMS